MNDSRPAGTRLRLSALGDISPALAAELKEHADFQTDGQGETDAVLVDGGTTIDDEALGGALKSGRPVIIAWPTEKSLAALLALTGQSTRGNPDAVIYRRLLHNGYVCHIVGDSEQPLTGMVGPSGAIRLGPPLGPALAKSLAVLPDGSALAQSMFTDPDTLAGYAIYSVPGPLKMPAPRWRDGQFCDLILGDNLQPMDAPFTVTVYVYYVNGGTNAGISPYYAVFVSVSNTSQCLPLSNAGNDRGWFRPAFGSVTVPLGYDYGNNQGGVPTLIGSSPNDADGSLVNIELSDTFPLIGNTSTGINSYEFSPQLGEQATYADWAVRRVSLPNFSPGTQAWELYQLRPWNVVAMPPKTLTNDQLGGFFDGNDTVLAMSDLAVSDLQFLNLTEWSFIPLGPTPTAPYDAAPSTPAMFQLYAYLLVVLMHNESACAKGEKMIFWHGDGSPSIPTRRCNYFLANLDLGVIANSKSLAKPS